jgi:hypothetical protein
MADEPEMQGTADQADDTDEGTVDWRAKYEAMRQHAREWETKAKANRNAADELEKLRAQNVDEQERAIARAERAESELQQLRASAERAEAYARVASKTGLPLEVAKMLNGGDEGTLMAQATQLKKLLPNYPERNDSGGGKAAARRTNADRFAEAFGL